MSEDAPSPPPGDETVDLLTEELDPASIVTAAAVPPPPPPPPARGRPASGRTASATPSRERPVVVAPRSEPRVPTPAVAPRAPQLTPVVPPAAPGAEVREPRSPAAPIVLPAPERAPGAEPLSEALNAHETARATVLAFEAELAAAPDAVRAARLQLHLGRLCEGPLTDLRGAELHYLEAHRLAPDLVPAIRALRRVLLARRRPTDALPLFDAEARLTADPRRRVSLLYAKGRLLEDTLSSPAAARDAYAAALEIDRNDLSVLRALERCEQAAEAWDALARTYGREAQAVSADPRLRAAFLIARARLAETRGGDTEQAVQLYESALRLDPSCAEAIAPLERLYHGARRWADLCVLLDKVAEHTSDPHVHAMALLRIGRVAADKLGNLDDGLAALERAARASPEDPVVLAELDRLLELAGRHESRLELLERRAAVSSSSDERVALLFRMGELAATRVGDATTAVRAYEAALAVDPRHLPSLQALAAHYAKAQDFPAVLRIHLAEAEATDDVARRASVLARVGEVLETRLGRPDEAAAQHARALALVPGHDVAFKALCRLHASAGRFRELVELHERTVELATSASPPDRERAIASLLRIGSLEEDHLREPAQAIHAYRRVLALDAAHLGAMHALQRACELGERHEELVDALELEARTTRDELRSLTLLHRAAEVLAERIGDRDRAIARFGKLLERKPAHAPTLASLARLYQQGGRWDELLGILRRELEGTTERPAKIALLCRMAELCDAHLRREDEAVTLWRRALDLDGTHVPALRALATRLAARRDWGELVRVLERELPTIATAPAKAAALHRIGEVYEDHLGQSERALAAYEQARATWPAHRAAADAVSRLRAERRDWPKLAEDLAQEAESTSDPMLASAALAREGELWRDPLGQPRRAIKSYQAVLERRPDHLGALLALEALERKIGAWGPLSETHERLAKATQDPGARVAALRDLARLLESRGPVSGADLRTTYDALLELAPGDPGALEALERIALASDDLELLARVDTHLAETASDATVAAFHHCRLAESLEARGHPGAVAAFHRALGHDPENLAAARGLRRAGERFGDPRAIGEGARREAALVRDPATAARLLVQSAAVLSGPLSEPAEAAVDLERALELDPTHEAAATALSAVLQASGEAAKLAELLARAAAASATHAPDRACALWEEVARLQADDLSGVPAAIVTLRRAREVRPERSSVLRGLGALLARDGQLADAASLLAEALSSTQDRAERRELQLELARVHAALGDGAGAQASLEALLETAPDDAVALQRLLALQRTANDEGALATARKLARIASSPREEAAALIEVAKLELERGQTAAATSTLVDAVAVEGPGGAASAELERLPDDAGAPRALAEGLRRYLTALPKDDVRAVATHLALAQLEAGEEVSTDGAVAALRRAIAAGAPEEPMRLAILERLLGDGRIAEALVESLQAVTRAPWSPEAWRVHSRALRQSRRTDEARLALAPLLVLGGATAEERALLASKAPRPAHARPASLPAEALRAVAVPGSYDTPAGVLLATLAEAFPKLFPSDLHELGLSSRDRIGPKAEHAVRALVDRIGPILAMPECDLYVVRGPARTITVHPVVPPALLVPASIGDLAEAPLVFLLTRTLVLYALGLHPVELLGPTELEVLLASAARLVAPGFGRGIADEESLDDQGKRAARALSRRGKKLLEQAAARHAATPRPDYTGWIRALHQSSMRAALLVADDLPASVEAIRATDRTLAGLEGPELVRKSEVVRDLVLFWSSELAHGARRRMGLLALGTPAS